MSFYEIVFGVLFVGAARLVFLFVIDTPDLAGFFSAAMLCILVVCDAMTTVLVADARKVYKTRLMLQDLLGSFCLASALLLWDTTGRNGPFAVSVNQPGILEHRVALFWTCLAVYMTGAYRWNLSACTYRDLPEKLAQRFGLWQPQLAVLFAVFAGVAFMAQPDVFGVSRQVVERVLSVNGFLAAVAYLLYFKIPLFDQLGVLAEAARITEGRRSQVAAWLMTCGAPVGRGDAALVSQWPQYTGQEAEYNYALDATGGWLANYNKYAQYKIVDGSGIVAVGILTEPDDKGENEAEFFILIRSNRRGSGIGTKLTEALVDLALYELGFERVILKVRDWNVHAQAVYRNAGFIETMADGKQKETVGRVGGMNGVRMLWMHCNKATREKAMIASLRKGSARVA